MNQIYKVIWSKTKNSYVVASEMAKGCTKSTSQHRITKSIVAGIIACIIGSGIALPVLAADKDTVTSAKANTTTVTNLGILKTTDPYTDYIERFQATLAMSKGQKTK